MADDTGRHERRGTGREQSASLGERVREPSPLLKRRVPSGRGATEQPNAAGDGAAALSLRFWCALVVTGVATGLAGDALMALLHSVQHLAFDYHSGTLLAAVRRSEALHRVVVLVLAGVVGGAGWFVIRRLLTRERANLDDVVWGDAAPLGVRRSLATSALSEIVIGMGASLGREAAPKLMGGVAASVTAGWARLTVPQRRLLIACGGGAGLAAVYNMPLAGGLFTAEILLGSVALSTVLPALACSVIATATAWLYLPNRPTYLDVPSFHASGALYGFAPAAGLLVGLVAVGFVRVMGLVSHHRATGRSVLVALPCALGALGLLGIEYPELFGNGKDLAHLAFLSGGGISFFLALALLKPLVTALCLGAGGTGGLFTPTLSTGAALGAALGGIWSIWFPGSPVGVYALIGAAALLGSAMQAPLTGIVAVFELTDTGFRIAVPLLIAVLVATLVVRYLDGYSIYSARLEAASAPTARAEMETD